MAQTILGIDFGHDALKLTLMRGGCVKRTAIADMPENLIREGRAVSVESAGELLRETMRENGIRCSRGAVLLSGPRVFVRDITMPRMSAEQLKINLPYEFRDYIPDELKNYIFDYAMLPDLSGDEDPAGDPGSGSSLRMHLTAAAAPKDLLEEYRMILRKAGMKLVMAAPPSCCYPLAFGKKGEGREYGVVDLGSESIRLYIYRGRCITGSRVLESGVHRLAEILADEKNVDIHLAGTILKNDPEACRNSEKLQAACGRIAVELMRALNFYRFSNPDSQLQELWLCGGGASIGPLRDAVCENLNLKVREAAEITARMGAEAGEPSLFPAVCIGCR